VDVEQLALCCFCVEHFYC